MTSRSLALPGVQLGTLDLRAEPWSVRAADLQPGGWARRLLVAGGHAAARGKRPLLGLCVFEGRTVWLCVRQSNLEIARTFAHEVTHALLDGADRAENECRAEGVEAVVGGLLRAGALTLTLRDRELDGARRLLLPAAEAEPYERAGRLEPAPMPWVGGVR